MNFLSIEVFIIAITITPVLLSNNTSKTNSTGICSLTGFKSNDPYPSLVKCYKYNNEACCMSVHDDYINNHLNNILTTSCLRKYSELEDLMCLGCHPLEMFYIDKTTRTINMCLDFALRLWNASNEEELNQPTKLYDNCGFKAFGDYLQIQGLRYIIPSQEFLSLYDFFDKVKIPFYEDYKINIFKEKSDYCYNKSHIIRMSNYALFIISMLFL